MKYSADFFEELAATFLEVDYNGVYAIVDEKAALSVKAFGFADLEKKIPLLLKRAHAWAH